MPHRPNISVAGNFKFDSRLSKHAFTSKEKMQPQRQPTPPTSLRLRNVNPWRPPQNGQVDGLRLGFAQSLNISDNRLPGQFLLQSTSAGGLPTFSTWHGHSRLVPSLAPLYRYASRQMVTAVPGMEPNENEEKYEPVASGSKRARMDGRRTTYSAERYPFPRHSNYLPAEKYENRRRSESSGRTGEVLRPCAMAEQDMWARVQLLRRWDYTDIGREHLRLPKVGLEFTVMTYNILAQCLLEDNAYLYRHCEPKVLEWDFRKARILKELKQSNADVLCLQEVQGEHYEDFFVPELGKLGYSGLYKKRTGGKKDGCAIFYKSNLFSLVDSTLVEYCKPGLSLLDRDRDNIALVAMLKPRGKWSAASKVCVANTHLLFNPGRGDIKLTQLRILLAEIDKFAYRRLSYTQRPLYYPIVMCGDMNSEPNCSLYEFVSTGNLKYEGLIAGDISGQADGYHRGRFHLEKELVPEQLGISDQCQYVDTISKRGGSGAEIAKSINSSGDKTVAENPMPATAGQDKASASTETEAKECLQSLFSTGWMTHRLNLVSAYGHNLGRTRGAQPAVSTHHRKGSCLVDYIFYSVHSKHSRVHRNTYGQQVEHRDKKEGLLSLLATYGLLSSDEIDQLGGLPNCVLPSDHLPLIARFLLRNS